MTSDREEELLRLAEAVSDASTVDWEEASDAYPALTPTLTGLQKVEAIANAFRKASFTSFTGTNRADGEIRSWGRLEILELISEGGVGEVYRARDPLLDCEVALRLRRTRRFAEGGSDRRAIEVGRRLMRVRHPNVLAVYGADIHSGRVGLWTELVEGPTLRELVREDGPLEIEEAVSLAIDLCRALAAIHEAGLVNGDVTAADVVRDASGRIVLRDFSSAEEMEPGAMISGPPVSVAPERLAGAPAAPVSDIYSLGVLIYFVLSGCYPVEGGDVAAIREQHHTHGPVPLDQRRLDIPGDLAEVVHRAIATNPELRYDSAREFERALRVL